MVKIAVSGFKCINLTTDIKKILSVHFSYNPKLKIQQILWKA